ncbi:hypothetical protein [Actinomadura violacea]|uniref:Helix-turn-helix domain containing protein n=1 Tax=Actinomadura violacea TaxID=2819934 RepID=A0ABS3RR69_9ACTN|nr:hypothetical protein [Actinomadura violacea]MBO2459255.1 hypothetical protein [Actinomadura violacea]
MARVRVIFQEEQNFDGTLVRELTVDAARLVLVGAQGEALCNVPVASIRSIDRGAEARTVRLRNAHRNHGRAWSGPEESQLREMWAAGTSVTDLTEHFGRSRNAINSAVRRLNLPPRDGEQPAGTLGSDMAP